MASLGHDELKYHENPSKISSPTSNDIAGSYSKS